MASGIKYENFLKVWRSIAKKHGKALANYFVRFQKH